MDSDSKISQEEGPPILGASPESATDEETPLGPLNWVLFASGVALMSVGYLFLAHAGRAGESLAGRLAPFCVIGGLAVFGLGFFSKTKG